MIMKYLQIKTIPSIALKSLMAFSIAFLSGCETDESQTVATFTNLVLDENFDTEGAPNGELWSFDIGTGIDGWGNQELQYYTDRPENVQVQNGDRKSTRLNSSHRCISYAVFCLKKKKKTTHTNIF